VLDGSKGGCLRPNHPPGGFTAGRDTPHLGVDESRVDQREPGRLNRLTRHGYELFSCISFVLLWATSYNEFDQNAPVALRVGIAAAGACGLYAAKHRPVHSMFFLAALCTAIGLFAPGLVAVELLLIVAIFLVSWQTSFSLIATFSVGVIGITLMYTAKIVGIGRSLDASIFLQGLVESGLAVGFGSQTRRLRLANEQLVQMAAADRRSAVVDERRRIANELHDVAAHLLSAIAVKSKLALRLDTHDDLRTANAFAGKTASEALVSMRTLVGVLSTDDTEVPLVPQPRLDELLEIQRRMTTAGLQVEMHVPEPLPELSRHVELAVVRIVQESLTNTLRHRGPGQVWVRIDQVARMLNVVIDDDGSAPVKDPAYESGHGLLGMRERAKACGGTLKVEASPQGGWRIAAQLPCL
jgi:signal transduction histidine kinase